MRISSTTQLVACGVLALAGCLSVEDRPTLGRVEVRVTADLGSDDFAIEDGWQVQYEELYASLGNLWLEPFEGGAECHSYTSTQYLRIVDLLSGRHRIATLFARGPCSLRFQIEGPGDH